MEIPGSFIVAIAVNMAMFIPAFFLKTDKLTDASYGLSFILVAGIVLFTNPVTIPKLILFGMIAIWGIRISAQLLIRVLKTGKDKRFDKIRDNFMRFGLFWLVQGFTVFVVLIFSTQYFVLSITPITFMSFIGIILWFTGLSFETIADRQKMTFASNPQNAGKWIETGLWKYSRHPNYFGEILLWFGLYIYTWPAIGGSLYLMGLISPLYIFFLIYFVSGIPILEKSADKKWGMIPEYQNYKKRTPILIPLVQSKPIQ